MAATPATTPLLGRIPRLRQWHVIWFVWGLLLGWFVWGGGLRGSTVSVTTHRRAENAFVGFANAALRRNWGACNLLTPTAAGEFLHAFAATRSQAAPSRRDAERVCAERLRRVPMNRITAFIPVGPGGMLYDGVSQGSDESRAAITFGHHVALLENTDAYGWRIAAFHRRDTAH